MQRAENDRHSVEQFIDVHIVVHNLYEHAVYAPVVIYSPFAFACVFAISHNLRRSR